MYLSFVASTMLLIMTSLVIWDVVERRRTITTDRIALAVVVMLLAVGERLEGHLGPTPNTRKVLPMTFS